MSTTHDFKSAASKTSSSASVVKIPNKEKEIAMCRKLSVLPLALLVFASICQHSVAADKINYPQKGHVLSIIVPYNAGGGADTDARILAPLLEKKLSIPVQVVNKPGAGTQVGMTELTSAKPDGYTILLGHFPGTVTTYLDSTRQTAYNRKNFAAIAFTCSEPFTFIVAKDSPHKSMKDVIDYAKANPEKFKVAVTGILLPPHLSVLELEKQTGVKFATVHFDGAAPGRTAFLGGHTDALVALVSEAAPALKGDMARVIGIMDTQDNAQLPGVKTMPEQGYNVLMVNSEGILAPAGTPSAIIQYLEAAFKEAVANETYTSRMKQLGINVKFKDAKESEQWLTQLENQVKPLIDDARKKQQ
jgi:tripartite-type tricarboxylate transporter receptor subunit TctC